MKTIDKTKGKETFKRLLFFTCVSLLFLAIAIHTLIELIKIL